VTDNGVTNRILRTEKIPSPQNTYKKWKTGGGVTPVTKIYVTDLLGDARLFGIVVQQ
jgi:hypothetical protein